MGFIYACFALTVCIGIVIKGKRSPAIIAAGTLAASLSFFALSNFGVWLTSGMYPHTSAGLMACYVAALPFFQYTLLGDFGLHLPALWRLPFRRTGIPRSSSVPRQRLNAAPALFQRRENRRQHAVRTKDQRSLHVRLAYGFVIDKIHRQTILRQIRRGLRGRLELRQRFQ